MLLEEPCFYLSHPILLPTSTGRKVQVNGLDMRLEVMRHAGVIPRNTLRWVAQLPGTDHYLVNDQIVDRNTAAELVQSGHIELPDGWWDYVFGLQDDTPVKAAKDWMNRAGEVSQDELDAKAPLSNQLASAFAS